MKKQRLISVAAVIALAAGSAVAIAPASNAAARVVTIGYQGPLTGEEAQVGIDELNGVKYAVKLFNAKNKGKIQVKIVEIDDQGSGTEAAKVAPRCCIQQEDPRHRWSCILRRNNCLTSILQADKSSIDFSICYSRINY
ncbi:MAG: ABC transporter substrate-binding protein [Actinomycetota bacterium]